MGARFITLLQVEEVEDNSHGGRGTWRLLSALQYLSVVLACIITVPAGFVTDFASVPRIPLAFWLAGDCAHQAAVLHDWLYTSHACTRAQADAVLREAAILSGVPSWRAWMLWAGVRVGGAGAWRADGQQQPPPVNAALEAVAA